jgi:hypothetical protein
VTNPWEAGDLSAERAVLLTLSVKPQDAATIARSAGLRDGDVATALQLLVDRSLAIREDDQYELTGPLCWFGDFAGALKYHARKNLLVTIPGESESHLYVCDIRIKGARPVGDPLTETASVLGCGRTSSEVAQAPSEGGSRPTCPDCASATATG